MWSVSAKRANALAVMIELIIFWRPATWWMLTDAVPSHEDEVDGAERRERCDCAAYVVCMGVLHYVCT